MVLGSTGASMPAAHSIRSFSVPALWLVLGCGPQARAETVQPKQATATATAMAVEYRDWDLAIATVKLPTYLGDATWYEYALADHALSSISISYSKLPPRFASDWVRDRRLRLVSLQLAEVDEVEPFSNPDFAIEGFAYHEKTATPPTKVWYLLVLAAKQDLVMFWIATQPTSANVVHELAQRIVPDDGRVLPPSKEWVWRRVFDLRVPIPRGATQAKPFEFEGERVTVIVTPGSIGQPLSLLRHDVGAKLTKPVGGSTHNSQGLPVYTLVSSGSDIDGEPMALAAASVEANHRSLLMQARAFGEKSGELISAWNDIVSKTTLREE
jgi:hypothetical protein